MRFRDPKYPSNYVFPAERLKGAKAAPRVLKPEDLTPEQSKNWRPQIGMAPSTQRYANLSCIIVKKLIFLNYSILFLFLFIAILYFRVSLAEAGHRMLGHFAPRQGGYQGGNQGNQGYNNRSNFYGKFYNFLHLKRKIHSLVF